MEPRVPLAFAALLLLAGCAGGDEEHESGADTEGADADADADADSDADADADAEEPLADDWPPDDPPRPFSGGEDGLEAESAAAPRCLDGSDQSVAGALRDCETPECLASGRCCQEPGRAFDGGAFDACVGEPELCGWELFGSCPAAVEGVPPELVLCGEGEAETGLVSPPEFGPNGTVTVVFVASLSPEGCGLESRCRGALGVVLTAQQVVSGATGVEPSVGLVLDAELEVVHLWVRGGLAASVPVEQADLAARRAYGFRVHDDGRVSFWVSMAESWAGGSLDDAEARWTSPPGLVGEPGPYRLAIHGRFEAGRGAVVGALRVDRSLCDEPASFARATGPARPPVLAGERAARPSVVVIPAGLAPPSDDDTPSLLMVFETSSGLAVATSWNGSHWRFLARILREPAPTPFGRVRRSAPALLVSSPEGGRPAYHLWFVGRAEDDGRGGPRSAILHATSEDGLHFEEDESVALPGDPSTPWRHEVGEPTVVEGSASELLMFFVGRDPLTGARALGRAISPDGRSWTVDSRPVRLEPGGPLDFERDGLAEPVVVRRGRWLHMWYAGLSGARARIGYAVSEEGDGQSFRRLGPVLGPVQGWEGSRLTGPAVLTLAGDPAEPGAVLHLWYAAGPEGGEAIGHAWRRVPGS